MKQPREHRADSRPQRRCRPSRAWRGANTRLQGQSRRLTSQAAPQPRSPVQILQFRSKRCARCWLVVSFSMLLKTSSRGAALLSGTARTDSCSWKAVDMHRLGHLSPPRAQAQTPRDVPPAGGPPGPGTGQRGRVRLAREFAHPRRQQTPGAYV